LDKVSPLYLVAEGTIVAKLNSGGLGTALCMLVGCFYLFNMHYPSKQNNFFQFLEYILLGNSKDARKRVAVNKFVAEL